MNRLYVMPSVAFLQNLAEMFQNASFSVLSSICLPLAGGRSAPLLALAIALQNPLPARKPCFAIVGRGFK